MRSIFITKDFFCGYLFALLWLNIGPWLIWKYKNSLNTNFLLGLHKLSEQIFYKYHKIFSKYFWYIIIFLPFVCYLFFKSTLALINTGINGPNDFYY